MKIYTKTGDKGSTSLVSGRRISKAEAIIEAYGSVDELNTFTGDLISALKDDAVIKDLTFVQNILFNVGSLLAKDEADFPNYPELKSEHITYLETAIDKMNEDLPKMTAFILPQGSPAISKAHVCRTVCRRAERRVIQVDRLELDADIIKYLNRLSDYFFVLARYLHRVLDVPETKWNQNL